MKPFECPGWWRGWRWSASRIINSSIECLSCMFNNAMYTAHSHTHTLTHMRMMIMIPAQIIMKWTNENICMRNRGRVDLHFVIIRNDSTWLYLSFHFDKRFEWLGTCVGHVCNSFYVVPFCLEHSSCVYSGHQVVVYFIACYLWRY